MQIKITNENETAQHLIAGLTTEDNCIEFFGIRKSKTVMFLRNGRTYDFKDLSKEHYTLLHNRYMSDVMAREFIRKMSKDTIRQVELFTYYTYGDLDHTPDSIDNKLQPAENFRHKINCISLKFDSKLMTIEGQPLSRRDLAIIDMIALDYPDKAIADALGIALPTLDTHKRNLYKKVKVQTKTALLKKSINEKIVMS